jgi:hypothetical protein
MRARLKSTDKIIAIREGSGQSRVRLILTAHEVYSRNSVVGVVATEQVDTYRAVTLSPGHRAKVDLGRTAIVAALPSNSAGDETAIEMSIPMPNHLTYSTMSCGLIRLRRNGQSPTVGRHYVLSIPDIGLHLLEALAIQASTKLPTIEGEESRWTSVRDDLVNGRMRFVPHQTDTESAVLAGRGDLIYGSVDRGECVVPVDQLSKALDGSTEARSGEFRQHLLPGRIVRFANYLFEVFVAEELADG